MITLQQLRREKRDQIVHLAERHGCHNVRVFGSVATGENKPSSDIDFLVDLDRGHDLLDRGDCSSTSPLQMRPMTLGRCWCSVVAV